MLGKWCYITVIWNDSFELEGQSASDTGPNQFGAAIEDRWRRVGYGSIAREQVRAEEKLQIVAIEAGVAIGMPRQMDGGEAMPNGDFRAIVQPTVGLERRVGEESSPCSLEQSTDSGCAAIAKTTFVMGCIKLGRGDPSPRFARKRSHVENVVEVAMRHDDSPDGFAIPASPTQGACKEIASSDEAPIDQVKSCGVAKHVKAQGGRADLKDVIAHELFLFLPAPPRPLSQR